eukprot:CAMPEP_0170429690 /NCGR_PEP_ID=MMETSP0117_2-20130122/40446_1 /TAXON_ID=400756 /ORGANISM="Durinskia baltica, Strain CSIRO CS-38" /LENGTH=1104 /DNA_ID=CAMNT_0010689083 /DNA_START=733 /DNA_END=4047 /DNA_ORIENTATION=+
MTLHEGTPQVLKDVHKYKASFRIRRRLSTRLEMAAALLEENKLTADEFEELRRVDHSYRRELLYEESVKLKGAVDAFGDDLQTIIDVLLNSSLIDKGGRWSQFGIILKVLEVADRAPDVVDFYLPQLLQAHLIIAEGRTEHSLVKLDLFQQALLVMAQKYQSLGLKMSWGLLATIGDFADRRCSQVQYSACVALLLQLEMVTTGYVSCIADKPTCSQLAGILIGAAHQQQEVGYEISALFLVRRRLQEVNDDEEIDRKIRKGLIGPDLLDAEGNLIRGALSLPPGAEKAARGPLIPSECLCIELLYQLGVGQAHHSRNRLSDDGIDDNDTLNDEGEAVEKLDKRVQSKDLRNFQLVEENFSPRDCYTGFQGFSDQLDFIQKLNVVVESLRFVDRPLRTKCLLKEIAKWNANPTQELGWDPTNMAGDWDPTNMAGEPFYRIMNIISEECRVFRTKARAPSMLVCEVLRDDLVPFYQQMLANQNNNFNPIALSTCNDSQEVESRSVIDSDCDAPESVANEIRSNIRTSSGQAIDSASRPNSLNKLEISVGSTSCTIPRATLATTPGSYGSRNGSTLIRRASRSVLTSNRLSVTKGISELCGPFCPSPSVLTSAGDSNVTTCDSQTVANISLSPGQVIELQHKPILNMTTGGVMRMSASGVFTPIPPQQQSGDNSLHSKNSPERLLEKSSELASPGNSHWGNSADLVDSGCNGSNGSTSAVSQVTQKVLSSAQRLLASGVIDCAEYELLIASDQHFQNEAAREEAVLIRNKVECAFGESWQTKKERILGDRLHALRPFFSPSKKESCMKGLNIYKDFEEILIEQDELFWPAWDLRSFILKSNDDLRQEVCCLQLMQLFKEIFEHFGLQDKLFLRPYRIICTGCSTGLVQVLPDTISLDALKKTDGFTTLSSYFIKTYCDSNNSCGEVNHSAYDQALKNFAASLAAYSLFSYLLLIKDRHNGNLMIDSAGHILHIDFGFLLSIAPGGSFSLETAPFKLTDEMVEVLGGLDSPYFGEFLTAFTKGFIALQSNAEIIVSALNILAHNSSFPCFSGKQSNLVIEKLRSRFRTELSVGDAVKHCLDLITNSYGHYGTRQYDNFQWITNGIMP